MDQSGTASGRLETEDLLAHSDALYRYAMSRLGDRPTAEDLVQDTLVTAVSKAPDFEGRSSVRTWLIGILRHKLLEHFRWNKRHPQDQPAPEDSDSNPPADPWFTAGGVWRTDPNQGLDWLEHDPDQALQRSELRAFLRLCIEHLPARLRQVFVLRELEALTPEDVSESAGIARNSLAVFLYRARQALRACLQAQQVEP